MLAMPDLPIEDITLSDGLRIKIWDKLSVCQKDWQALEAERPIGPVFQSFAWQQAWFDTLGMKAMARPYILIGYQEGRPVFVLPFAKISSKGLRKLVWSGGKHSNFNFGLFTTEMGDYLNADDRRQSLEQALLEALGRTDVDLLQLSANPAGWQGLPHIFSAQEDHAGMTPAFGVDLTPGFDALFEAKGRKRMRKKHRWQRRYLESENHDWRMVETSDPAEFGSFLDAFYAQKSARFKALGISDVFSQTEVQAFVDALGAPSPTKKQSPSLHFYGLEVDGKLIATYAGGSQNGCFSAYFNSFDEEMLPRLSAGEMLLGEMIRHRCALGDHFFDLGMGDERYKHLWCDVRIDYFTLASARTLKGQIAGFGGNLIADLKRTVRSNEKLWSGYKKLRKAKSLVA